MLPLRLLEWIVGGAAAGWIGARLIRFEWPLGRVGTAAATTAVGMLGGLLGGGLLWVFGAQLRYFGVLNIVLAAVFGAVLLLWLVRTVAGVGRPH